MRCVFDANACYKRCVYVGDSYGGRGEWRVGKNDISHYDIPWLYYCFHSMIFSNGTLFCPFKTFNLISHFNWAHAKYYMFVGVALTLEMSIL